MDRVKIATATVAALWFIIASLLAHPDYLAYFNEAVRNPEWTLAESDLDWGQDLQRLAVKLKELNIEKPLSPYGQDQPNPSAECQYKDWIMWPCYEPFYLNYFGSADPHQFDWPPYQTMEEWKPVKGWIAVSVHVETIESAGLVESYGLPKGASGPLDWLTKHYKPVAMAGKSIKIYHVE